MAVISTININTTQATKSINELEKNLAKINEDLKKVDVNSDAFKELKKQAADAKLELDNINKSIESSALGLEDMTHNMADAANAIMGGFTAAQGALNLFGVESEEVVKSIQKLQSLMAISQGIDQVAKGITAFKKLATAIKASSTAQKIFNTLKTLEYSLFKKSTASINIDTASKKTNTAATKAATVATTAFNKAMMAVKFIAIATAIAAVVQGLIKLTEHLKNSNKYADELNQKLINAATHIQEFQINLWKTINNLDKLYISLDNINWEFDKQFIEINKLIYSYDEYIKKLTTADRAQSALSKNTQQTYTMDFVSDMKSSTDALTSTITEISNKSNALLDFYSESVLSDINTYVDKIDNSLSIISDEFKKDFNEETTENIMDQLRAVNNYTSVLQRLFKNEQNSEKFKKILASQPEEVQELWSKLNEQLQQYFTNINNYSNNTISTINDLIAKEKEINDLELQRKQNDLAIRKSNIDFQASEDANYKDSVKYYEDLLSYYEDLLKLQQRGTLEYNNTYNAIKHIIPLLSEARAAADIKKSSNKSSIDREEEEIDYDGIAAEVSEQLDKLRAEKAAAQSFYDELMNMRATDTYLFMQQQDAQAAYLDECLKKQLISYAQYTTAKKELDKQSKDYQAKMASEGLSISADILSSLADTLDETNEKQFKAQKAMRISSATISVISGVIDALTGKFTARATPADWVLAIMQATSIAAAGGAQIAQIARQKYSGSETSVSSSGAISATLSTPTQISEAVQNANIESAVTDSRVYVLESDIKQITNKVSVQEQENRY